MEKQEAYLLIRKTVRRDCTLSHTWRPCKSELCKHQPSGCINTGPGRIAELLAAGAKATGHPDVAAVLRQVGREMTRKEPRD